MSRKSICFAATIVLTSLALVATLPSDARAQSPEMGPVKLMANGATNPPTLPDNMTLAYFCKEVEKRTNGLITWRYAWSGALTKRGEEIDAQKSGLSDVATVTVAYYPTKLYLNNFARSVPFVSTDSENQAHVIKELYDKVAALSAEWEKHGSKLLFVNMTNSFELQSRLPIVKIQDFKGKKIVISGVEGTRWIKVTGAVPVTVPLPERALAFQTGMIDGSVLSFDVTKPFGLHEYAKHATMIGLGAWPATGIAINKKLFDGFPKNIQQIILAAAEEANNYHVRRSKTNEAEAIEAMKKAAVTFHTMSVEDKTKWMELMGNQPAEWVKKGEELHLPAREVMDTYLALVKKSGHKFPKEW